MSSLTILADEEHTFHHQYGLTLAQWAAVEQRMFLWFQHVTKLSENMARGVFYSSKNFNGRADMLEEAVKRSDLDQEPKAVVLEVVKRARSYSTFRNKITHGEAIADLRPASETYLQFLLIEGRDLKDEAEKDAICVDYLAWGCDQIRTLSKAALMGLVGTETSDQATLKEALALIHELPRGLYPNPRDRSK